MMTAEVAAAATTTMIVAATLSSSPTTPPLTPLSNQLPVMPLTPTLSVSTATIVSTLHAH